MVTYENLSMSPIPNTVMQKMYIGGVHKAYSIKPISGYMLHDNAMDVDVIDENTVEILGKELGYSPSSVDVTCGANYDFQNHIVTDENGNTFVAYGNRDFFAVPEGEV